MVRGRLAALACALALAACGDGGSDGPGAVEIDSVSTAGTRARIEAAIEETAGVEARVDCPETVDVDGDSVSFVCTATAPDGTEASVSVHSLSRPDHLDFALTLAPTGAIEASLEEDFGGEAECPDLVEETRDATITCTLSTAPGSVEVALDGAGRFSVAPP